jgi:hypothetical protein
VRKAREGSSIMAKIESKKNDIDIDIENLGKFKE